MLISGRVTSGNPLKSVRVTTIINGRIRIKCVAHGTEDGNVSETEEQKQNIPL
jgi:hypothetical protein